MSLETFVVTGVPELGRALDATRWWAAVERNAPRALLPVARAMQAAAPKGRTGKLARGFDLRTKRISQGFVQGIEVDIGARVPYGHLIESGHRVIARGPGRKGHKRGVLRKMLKARRLAGGQGFVAGRFFGRGTMQSMETQTMSLLERLLRQELLR